MLWLAIGRALLGLCLVMVCITLFIPHTKHRLTLPKRGDASSQSQSGSARQRNHSTRVR